MNLLRQGYGVFMRESRSLVMTMFWRTPQFVFRIEKLRPGKYLNSPRTWAVCGYIQAANRGQAAIEACFKVGSSQVRVIPEEPA